MNFNAGDDRDYMGISIKDGSVGLSINLGNGRLDTGIKTKRFDDDVWHHVVIFRVAQQVKNHFLSMPFTFQLGKEIFA